MSRRFKKLPKNKTPGTEGLTAEFYIFFWDKLNMFLVNSFNFGFQKGELSISQRQSMIRLIPKRQKSISFKKLETDIIIKRLLQN